MAKYFFDLSEGSDVTKDDEGRDIATDDEAMREAAIIMAQVATDLADREVRGRVSVSVRKNDGTTAFAGSLLFSVKPVA